MAKDHITRLLADTSGFDSQVGKSMRFVTDFYKSIDELNKGMIGLSEQQKSMLINMGKVQPTTKSAEVAVAQLEYVCQTLEKSYAKMSDSIKSKDWAQSIGANVKQLQDRIASLKAEMTSVPKKAYVSPVTSFEPISGGAGGAGGAVAAAGGKNLFGKIMGGNLAARAVMDTLRFVKNTVKDAIQANMEFEYSNATLSAVLGKTKEEIMDLTIQAQRLGSTSLYSAKEISELQIVLARLGFNQTEIKDSTDAIAKLALATGVDLEKAASMTGSAMRSFGYSTKEAARVASVLGVATTKSALDMQKLQVGLAYASANASAAGFEIEEVVAMLGKMVDKGQQATTAGVNIRNIMIDLSSSSSKLRKAFKTVLGKDTIKGFDDFIESLRQLREAGINLEDVSATMQKRVSTGFLNLLADTEGVKDLAEALKGCTGELDKMAEKMENTLSGATKKLSNSWNALMLTFQNSNGTFKSLIDNLTSLINKATKASALAEGGAMAVSAFERDVTAEDRSKAARQIKGMREIGYTDDSILKIYGRQLNDLQRERDNLNSIFEEWTRARKLGFESEQMKKVAPKIEALGYENNIGLNAILAKRIADLNYKIEVQKLYVNEVGQNNGTGGGGTDEIRNGEGLGLREMLSKSAVEGVDGALLRYEIAIKEAALEYEAGKLNKKQYDQRILSAMESVFKAYGTAAATLDDPKYKAGFEEWAGKISEQAAKIAGDEHIDAVNKALQKYEQAIDKATLEKEAGVIDEIGFAKAQLAAQEQLTKVYEDLALETNSEEWGQVFRAAVANTRQFAETLARLTEEARKAKEQTNLDKRILRGLQGATNRAKLGYDEVGLTDIGARIAQGTDISNEEWLSIQNTINAKLKGLNLDPIQIDFETGSIEKLKSDLNIFKDQLSQMSSVVGSLSTIRSSIDSMVHAFDEGTNPLDTFFALFEGGINLMQSGIAIYEAINKLQEISNALEAAHNAAIIDGTTAKTADTGVTAANTAAHITNMQAKIASSHAWMGIAGVAIAAGVIAAFMALIKSRSQSKQGSFLAGGGVVGVDGIDGMSPRGTDVVPAMLTPGEVVLNHAQQGALANQLQGAGRQMIMVQGESYVSGEQIKIVYNNYSKRRGVKLNPLGSPSMAGMLL